MLHAAQRPTAGALHDAPLSTFSFLRGASFFFSAAAAGMQASAADSAAMSRLFTICAPPLKKHPVHPREIGARKLQ
jgi:hypothetical protein